MFPPSRFFIPLDDTIGQLLFSGQAVIGCYSHREYSSEANFESSNGGCANNVASILSYLLLIKIAHIYRHNLGINCILDVYFVFRNGFMFQH